MQPLAYIPETMSYRFDARFNETQRDNLVLSLRRAGYPAYRESDTLITSASRSAIAMVFGTALIIR